ncbi:MAG: hypothetical protein WC373_11600 [Smithella sp.]
MSCGGFCTCDERKKPLDQRNWKVFARNSNHSAFNGRKWTPSNYSAVRCLSCQAIWRTKAKYVNHLKNDPEGYEPA